PTVGSNARTAMAAIPAPQRAKWRVGLGTGLPARQRNLMALALTDARSASRSSSQSGTSSGGRFQLDPEGAPCLPHDAWAGYGNRTSGSERRPSPMWREGWPVLLVAFGWRR